MYLFFTHLFIDLIGMTIDVTDATETVIIAIVDIHQNLVTMVITS